ncbi:MAG: hypothetical protein M1834_008200 [Cirrosporium novae-zelandiae]|nr:MAG: hypothetical protein M1834_008200 [Cirrosporium novae-zelandiae]
MRQNRKVRVMFLTVVLVVLTILYYESGARRTRNEVFYKSTVTAINTKTAAAKEAADLEVKDRLKAAELAAKKAADEKSPKPSPASVQVPMEPKGGVGAPKIPGTGEKWEVVGVDGKTKEKEEVPEKTLKEKEIELELNGILKRSPIIIFSKSYCPFSKKAKRILLDDFQIDPPPFVVELDQHPMGADLQSTLHDITGRRTVPNILINGKSIGGGDDVEKLKLEGTLVETVKKMGGTRIYGVKEKEL